MTRFVRLFVLSCLAALITTRGADAGELNYGLYVLGVPLADVMLSIDLASPAYRIGLHYHTIGLASLVAGDRMDTSTSGVFEGDRPRCGIQRFCVAAGGEVGWSVEQLKDAMDRRS